MDTITTTMETNNHNTTSSSFLELLEEYEYPTPQRGDIILGEVLLKQEDVVYIDVGAKRDAIIPYEEVQDLDEGWLDSVAIGDQISVYVINTPRGSDNLLVSVEKVLEEQDWDNAQSALEAQEIVELEVIGYNKGGLLVGFGRIRGFVPNSHVSELRHLRDQRQLVSSKAKIVGEKLPLQILEIDRERKRLVLSATTVEDELAQKQLEELVEGQKMSGTVVNIKPYGAFVDLGYVTGLLHISQLAWRTIDHPADILEVGDEVEVVVERIDLDKKRVSLNRRDLLPSPLEEFSKEHGAGDLVEGKVTNVRDFGAFVEIGAGVEGLVHVSEMNLTYGAKPAEALQPGDEILVRILRIEPDRGRVGLSISKVQPEEQIEWMQQHHEAISQDEDISQVEDISQDEEELA